MFLKSSGGLLQRKLKFWFNYVVYKHLVFIFRQSEFLYKHHIGPAKPCGNERIRLATSVSFLEFLQLLMFFINLTILQIADIF